MSLNCVAVAYEVIAKGRACRAFLALPVTGQEEHQVEMQDLCGEPVGATGWYCTG